MKLTKDPANTVRYFEELNQYMSAQGRTFRNGPMPTYLRERGFKTRMTSPKKFQLIEFKPTVEGETVIVGNKKALDALTGKRFQLVFSQTEREVHARSIGLRSCRIGK